MSGSKVCYSTAMDLDLMPAITDPVHRDLILRWAPSGTQIDSAKRLLAETPDERVIVPLILLGKESFGVWTTDVEVRPVDGAWVEDDDGQARKAAITAAREALGDRPGTVSWVVIQADGSWFLFEEIHP